MVLCKLSTLALWANEQKKVNSSTLDAEMKAVLTSVLVIVLSSPRALPVMLE